MNRTRHPKVLGYEEMKAAPTVWLCLKPRTFASRETRNQLDTDHIYRVCKRVLSVKRSPQIKYLTGGQFDKSLFAYLDRGQPIADAGEPAIGRALESSAYTHQSHTGATLPAPDNFVTIHRSRKVANSL